ncbi:helix-turn-helix domain-containing protein [Aquimarina sp. RZ0]|uniref:helix-turn-helix domain-containing protein n=1 Tax=Aquimarina sp. RZ0 TaxID=2607730 RepID=UPI0011F3437E|nr:helix-turn-helix domain-containing protein [Aquimarina sp. RZ0]KAA1247702.1 helix-turn-helix domain-containing protein [Aquimarina sp. RZ0]
MESFIDIRKPSKDEQLTARKSYDTLAAILEQLETENPEIEIKETQEKIKVPLHALKLLAKILKGLGQGTPVSIVPVPAEMTTQAAAQFLGCSRPHLVKLLEEGQINFTKIGKHRRVKFDDVVKYKKGIKTRQKDLLRGIMKLDEELGMYDS